MTTHPSPAADPFDSDLNLPGTSQRRRGPSFPILQWVNGNDSFDAAESERSRFIYSGGFFRAERYMGEHPFPSAFKPITLKFKANKDSGLCALVLRVAVLATRFRWELFHKPTRATSYFQRGAYNSLRVLKAQGTYTLRGNVHALVGLPDLDTPVVLTFSGTPSRAFEQLLKAWDKKVIAAAQKFTSSQEPFQPYAFYMTLQAGAHQPAKEGESATVTLPIVRWPETVDLEWLKARYVGREARQRYIETYTANEAWAAAWDNLPGPAAAPRRLPTKRRKSRPLPRKTIRSN